MLQGVPNVPSSLCLSLPPVRVGFVQPPPKRNSMASGENFGGPNHCEMVSLLPMVILHDIFLTGALSQNSFQKDRPWGQG